MSKEKVYPEIDWEPSMQWGQSIKLSVLRKCHDSLVSVGIPHAQQEVQGFEGIRESRSNRRGDEDKQEPGEEREGSEVGRDEEEEGEGRGD